MKKLATGLLVGLFAAAAAQAADVNVISGYTPEGAGVTENPRVTGFAVLNYDDTNTTVFVFAARLLPNTTYGVAVDGADGGFISAGDAAFTTGPFFGIGVFSYLYEGGNIATDGVVTIYRASDGDPGQVSPEEVRAVGGL